MTEYSASRRLYIIVPIYKNAGLVRACIDSLREHIAEIAAYEPRFILINDSPDDEEVAALLQRYEALDDDMSVIRNAENHGFVRSVNSGLAIAQRDGFDVLLVNADTQTFEGTLAELLKAAHADPQIGFASPRSNNASICSLPHFFGGSPPTPKQAFDRWVEISRTMPAFHFSPTGVGFYMFISHVVLANHGGLREDFGLGYEEENDLVMRAGKLGTRAIIVNRAFAYHAGSASFNLTNIDLGTHKHGNLLKLSSYHPEFLPLVSRYEGSPHYRAERLMTGLLKDAEGRIKVVFDLSGMGQHYNGTNELAVAVLRSMATRQAHCIRLAAVASIESFRAHRLDEVSGLEREEPGAPGMHCVAVRMAQPFDQHHLNTLESMAPINLFAMLDTISEDCGPLALEGGFLSLWDHVARHANGLFFISRFSELAFCNRHRAAWNLPRWAHLLPTRISCYARERITPQRAHILVVGNHFAHKGSDVAARAIAAAFPTVKIVALGSDTRQTSNITSLRSGLLDPIHVNRLFSEASIVVLPSHVEGFGLGFMHALASGRPIVARRIPATEEIIDTLDDVEGVFLFDHDGELLRACTQALQRTSSSAIDTRTKTWDDWADGLAHFCLSVAGRNDVFETLVSRIAAADQMRRGAMWEQTQSTKPSAVVPVALSSAKPLDLESLLALDGRKFVEHAYATLLFRPADEIGLREYIAQLDLGVHKVTLLQAMAKSPEGRLRDATLPGLDAMAAQIRKARTPLYKRFFSG
jgi:GT2 family glycosyltransferase